MKVICRKRHSDVENFTDGKEYECFHEVNKEFASVRWIKDDLNKWLCICPDGSRCTHLTANGPQIDWFGKKRISPVGCWELSDSSRSKELYYID